jgi:hypothetical protein
MTDSKVDSDRISAALANTTDVSPLLDEINNLAPDRQDKISHSVRSDVLDRLAKFEDQQKCATTLENLLSLRNWADTQKKNQHRIPDEVKISFHEEDPPLPSTHPERVIGQGSDSVHVPNTEVQIDKPVEDQKIQKVDEGKDSIPPDGKAGKSIHLARKRCSWQMVAALIVLGAALCIGIMDNFEFRSGVEEEEMKAYRKFEPIWLPNALAEKYNIFYKAALLDEAMDDVERDLKNIQYQDPDWKKFDEKMSAINAGSGDGWKGLENNTVLLSLLKSVQSWYGAKDIEVTVKGGRTWLFRRMWGVMASVEAKFSCQIYSANAFRRPLQWLAGRAFGPTTLYAVLPWSNFKPPEHVDLEVRLQWNRKHKVDTVVLDKITVNGKHCKTWQQIRESLPASALHDLTTWAHGGT